MLNIMRVKYICILLLLFSVVLNSFSQVIVSNISYISANDTDVCKKEKCKLDICYFNNQNKKPVVIFFHGGGLTTGSKYLPGLYRDAGYIEVAPEYRFSQNAKCPAYINDAAEAVAWVWRNIEKYGGDKRKIIVSGHSAGAYITSMLAMDTTYLQKYGINPDSIWVFFSESAQMTTHFTVMSERGITVGSDNSFIDKYAPLYYKRRVKSNVVLAIGDRNLDMAGRYQQNKEMYRILDSLGVKVHYWEFAGENHSSMDSVSRVKFITLLKDGSIFESAEGNTAISINPTVVDSNFLINKGCLYSISGEKVKENPLIEDLIVGAIYIYKTNNGKSKKVIRFK